MLRDYGLELDDYINAAQYPLRDRNQSLCAALFLQARGQTVDTHLDDEEYQSSPVTWI